METVRGRSLAWTRRHNALQEAGELMDTDGEGRRLYRVVRSHALSDIIELYQALEQDDRLQKNWERNQPRVDRALESPLIARTPREVATAALLVMKLKSEPDAEVFIDANIDEGLITFARSQGAGGARLANVIEGKKEADRIAVVAAVCSLRFYRDRSADNPLVRLGWSQNALERLSASESIDIINPALKPTWAKRKAHAVKALAALLIEPDAGSNPDLRKRLRSLPGLGPERADAVGVFAFKKGWPIVDEYLWRLMARHSLLDPDEEGIRGYDRRGSVFKPYWEHLLAARTESPGEIAATLYLWADEAERFGYEMF